MKSFNRHKSIKSADKCSAEFSKTNERINIMKEIKICNQCYELYDDNSVKQFDSCPSCGGEIIFIDRDEYLKACSDEDAMDDLRATLIEYGSPESLRELNVSCSFYKQKDADEFVSDMNSKGYCPFMEVLGCRGEWTAAGSETVTLSEMQDTINAINEIVGNHPTKEWPECVRISFVKTV